ncbi:DUF2889 domain-containing protein [Comamonas faecalis]|uniref:DUF2889 domain-containing protein n=1 Tax=Comamonas faecalis TaxID=1387849 RepID=A0ABP7RZK4_9BURK
MPLPPPVSRTARHLRRVTYHGYERDDGLWDIEGELIDSKPVDTPILREPGTVRPAGAPIHLMRLRVTVDRQLTVHAIAAAMDAHPLHDCQQALQAMQSMVGANMARGWRQAIQHNLGGVAGCTHMRELLFNLATAAFQSISSAFDAQGDAPPRHLGQCTGWAFDGRGVREYYPQFHKKALVRQPGSRGTQ